MDQSSPALFDGDDVADLEVYGLEQLLAVAGERLGEEISPRTVRLYATQGLIDRPGKEGRSAIYSRRHLLQLLLIRSLARRGLSLSAIAPLCVLADAELEQQLEQLDGEGATAIVPSAPVRNEAIDYLRDLSSAAGNSEVQASEPPSFARNTNSMSPVLGMLSTPLSSFSRSSRSRSGSPAGIACPWPPVSNCTCASPFPSHRLAPAARSGCNACSNASATSSTTFLSDHLPPQPDHRPNRPSFSP